MQIYLFLKSIHILSIISWMAGVLYFFRLLIYYFENRLDENRVGLLSVMAQRLYRYITVPAMVSSILTGLSLIVLNADFLIQFWLWLKLLCVLFLVLTTLWGNKCLKQFQNRNYGQWTSGKLRVLNEVPTLLMMLIVFAVVFKWV